MIDERMHFTTTKIFIPFVLLLLVSSLVSSFSANINAPLNTVKGETIHPEGNYPSGMNIVNDTILKGGSMNLVAPLTVADCTLEISDVSITSSTTAIFAVNATLIMDNVTIISSGNGIKTENTTVELNNVTVTSQDTALQITFTGGKINGTFEASTGYGIYVEKCSGINLDGRFTGSSAGAYFDSTKNILVRNSFISGSNGINAVDSTDITVISSQIKGNGTAIRSESVNSNIVIRYSVLETHDKHIISDSSVDANFNYWIPNSMVTTGENITTDYATLVPFPENKTIVKDIYVGDEFNISVPVLFRGIAWAPIQPNLWSNWVNYASPYLTGIPDNVGTYVFRFGIATDYRDFTTTVLIEVKEHVDEIYSPVFIGTGIIITALAISLLTESGRYSILKLFFFLPLYSRIPHHKLMDNETRENIFKYILYHPGVPMSDIRRAVEVSQGTLYHHLMRLEKEKVVKSRIDGKKRRFYPTGDSLLTYHYVHLKDSVEMAEDKVFLTARQKDIIDVITRKPGINQIEIARFLNISKQVVFYHLKVLVKNKMIKTEKTGRVTKCYPLKDETVKN